MLSSTNRLIAMLATGLH